MCLRLIGSTKRPVTMRTCIKRKFILTVCSIVCDIFKNIHTLNIAVCDWYYRKHFIDCSVADPIRSDPHHFVRTRSGLASRVCRYKKISEFFYKKERNTTFNLTTFENKNLKIWRKKWFDFLYKKILTFSWIFDKIVRIQISIKTMPIRNTDWLYPLDLIKSRIVSQLIKTRYLLVTYIYRDCIYTAQKVGRYLLNK